MAVMLTYRCCFDIIKNKKMQVNDMKLFIRLVKLIIGE